MLAFLIGVIFAIVVFLLYVKWCQNYWQRKGVPTYPQEFFFGEARKILTKQGSLGKATLEIYQKFKELGAKHGGVYLFWAPIYMPVELSLIKDIFQKDFRHFTDHGFFHHPNDVLSMHLFNLEGDKWKALRAKLTPTFTSGKIKMMFETVVDKTGSLEKKIDDLVAQKKPFVIKDILGRYTTDIIASCGFGIEVDSINDPDNDFRKYGKKSLDPKIIKFLCDVLPRNIVGLTGYKFAGKDATEFFTSVVKETIQIRERNNIYRKDFMHLLLQLKNQGYTSDSTKVTGTGENGVEGKSFLTEEDIMAQCFVFFLAGFETSSTTMTFALLELSRNPEIQEKLRKEIHTVLKKHDGVISYDAIMEMQYLDKVVKETLRKFPALPMIPRKCTMDYKVPGTNVVIKKGTRVYMPVWGVHMDPQYYPNPEVFDPERFSEENKASRPDFTFLPFGEGPRICIGLRFGLIQTKVGLVSLLRNFEFTLNEKTAMPIEMEPANVVNSVKGEVWLDAKKINS